jgi:purine-binding chemotaxis protein CheW
MSRDPDEPTPQRELSARLHQLEAELKTLRRELAQHDAEQRPVVDRDFGLLRCRVGSDDYGIPIEHVTEILRYVHVTRVADVSAAVAGVINVRGEVVAVIDAHSRFGREPAAPRRGTAIVLTRVRGRAFGLIVDQVLDLVTAQRGTLRAPDGPLSRAHAVLAIATLDTGVAQIVDLEQVLSGTEWTSVASAIRLHESSRPERAREGQHG